MSDKKATICTVLFSALLIAVIIGSYFIRNDELGISLFELIKVFATSCWTMDLVNKFYTWLRTKEE